MLLITESTYLTNACLTYGNLGLSAFWHIEYHNKASIIWVAMSIVAYDSIGNKNRAAENTDSRVTARNRDNAHSHPNNHGHFDFGVRRHIYVVF